MFILVTFMILITAKCESFVVSVSKDNLLLKYKDINLMYSDCVSTSIFEVTGVWNFRLIVAAPSSHKNRLSKLIEMVVVKCLNKIKKLH